MPTDDAYRGWSRVLPHGPWRPVCSGPTAGECWRALLRLTEAAAQSEQVVLPAGVSPERGRRR